MSRLDIPGTDIPVPDLCWIHGPIYRSIHRPIHGSKMSWSGQSGCFAVMSEHQSCRRRCAHEEGLAVVALSVAAPVSKELVGGGVRQGRDVRRQLSSASMVHSRRLEHAFDLSRRTKLRHQRFAERNGPPPLGYVPVGEHILLRRQICTR